VADLVDNADRYNENPLQALKNKRATLAEISGDYNAKMVTKSESHTHFLNKRKQFKTKQNETKRPFRNIYLVVTM
jgi:hypothetical protein